MLTRHGWAALAAAAVSIIAGRLFGLVELYVAGAALIVLVLLALFAVARPLPKLEVDRVARPATVAVGEPARVDLRITNLGRVRTPRLRLWEPVGERGGAPMQVAPLPAGESAAAAYRVPTSQRGVLHTGPLRVQRTDVLGLCRSTAFLPGSGEVLVVPERVPLGFPDLTSSGRLGAHLRMRAMGRTGSEFHSQREYVPGDDLRRINWKSSARVGDLIVRETAMEGVHRCLVVLDADPASYDPDGFERAISAAASIVTGAAGAGVATRLVAPGLDLRGNDVAHESLRWLATMQPRTDGIGGALAGGTHSDGLGLVVVVSGTAGSAAEGAARAASGPDETMVLVTTMTAATGHRFGVTARSLSELEHSWQTLVVGARSSSSRRIGA